MVSLRPLLTLLAFQAVQVLAVPAAICSQAPYKNLLPLSAVPAAESFCSAKFPLPACTSTATSTSVVTATATTSTTVATNTVTTTTQTVTATTGTTTVDSTVTTVTVTVTVATQTNTNTATATTTSTTTVTSTSTQDNGLKKRAYAATTTSKSTKTTANPISSLLSSLESQALSVIKTACSCIEVQPACKTVTATATSTTTSTSTVSLTATTSVAATTTVNVVETDTRSVTATQTASVTATTTTTTTTTITVTATATQTVSGSATYTKVYQNTGTDGSAYNHYSDATDFNTNGDVADYTEKCAQFCDAHPGCKMFFVSYFPPCQGTGGDAFCTVDTIPYDSSYLQTGIGLDYRGCPAYTKGVAYNRVS